MEKDKIYIINEASGQYSDYISWPIFATKDRKTAYEYKEKYDKLLQKLKDFYLGKRNESMHLIEECDEALEWVMRHQNISEEHGISIIEVDIR